MGRLVLLDDYRAGLTVKSITTRLVRLGHDATTVSKTIAELLREKRLMSMAELCAYAIRRLEQKQTEAEAHKLCKPRKRLHSGTERGAFARALRLVVWNEP